jgi:hypothetical protein
MALEERLNTAAKKAGADVMRYRRHVAFDRFLARLFRHPTQYLVAKGGYTMELRLEHARTTKDIDFSFSRELLDGKVASAETLRHFFQESASVDMGDHFEFVVGESTLELDNAPYGGYRFPVEARMDGRRFVRFSVDLAAGDCWILPHPTLQTHDWLDFAGIPPAAIPVISLEQQFAEKLHAYTQLRDHPNSRVKDLLDMYLIVGNRELSPQRLRTIVRETFAGRDSSLCKPVFHDPPGEWKARYARLAGECGIDESIQKATEIVRAFCASTGIIAEGKD